jgi:hypothetical protein
MKFPHHVKRLLRRSKVLPRNNNPREDNLESQIRGEEFQSVSGFPIGEFPPELLAEVFYWHILDAHEIRDQVLDHFLPSCCWITIRHVCRSWRHVARTFPQLSAYICLTRPSLVQDLLDRSGGLPLYVYYPPVGRNDILKCTRLLLPHLHRVSHADFTRFAKSFSLNLFHLSALHEPKTSILRFAKLEFPLRPVLLFQNFQFPQLEDLSYTGGNIEIIKPMIAPSLRHLFLCNCITSIKDLVLSLEPLVYLEELVLEEVLQPHWVAVGINPEPWPVITLPRLRRFFIANSRGDDAIHALRHLLCPSATTILHYSYVTHFDPSLYDALSSILLTRAVKRDNYGVVATPVSMSLRVNYIHSLLTLWTERQSMSDLSSEIPPDDFAVLQLQTKLSDDRLVYHFLRQLPMSLIQSAALQERTLNAGLATIWKGLPRSMTHLEELFIEYVVSALSNEHPSPWYDAAQEDVSLLFPALKRVVAKKMCLDHWYLDNFPVPQLRLSDLASDLCSRCTNDSLHATFETNHIPTFNSHNDGVSGVDARNTSVIGPQLLSHLSRIFCLFD